jgi:uncharacterized protein (TIGR02246 family)
MTSKASELVAGAKQWASYYGDFPNGEEGAVFTIALRLRAAWDAGDADTLADLFTEDGSMLIGDEQLRGREAIRAYLTEQLAGAYRGSRVADEPVQVKFLADGVALAVTKGGFINAGETAIAPENENRATWVVRKEDGDYKLVSHQTSPLRG